MFLLQRTATWEITKEATQERDPSAAKFVVSRLCAPVPLRLTWNVTTMVVLTLLQEIKLLIQQSAKKICLQEMFLVTMASKENVSLRLIEKAD